MLNLNAEFDCYISFHVHFHAVSRGRSGQCTVELHRIVWNARNCVISIANKSSHIFKVRKFIDLKIFSRRKSREIFFIQ